MRFRFPLRSLRAWLILTYLVLIAASLGLLAWRVGASLDASRFAETQRDQEGRAILAASAAGDWLVNYRDQKISFALVLDEATTLSREINQPIVVLDAQGKVLVDTQHPNEIGADDSQEPEIVSAQAGRIGSAIRFDPDDNADALFTVAPVRSQREVIGLVRLELQMNLVREASQQLWIRIIGATVLAAFVTMIVSLLFARALTDPLAEISRAATALANGDLQQRIRVNGPQELERLAHSFNFMAQRISRVMNDQRAFVANAAHELRTPLTTVRLRAEALQEGAKDDPQVASQFLADIVNETDRLTRLVDQLLDLSRIETGMVTPHRESISMPRIAQAVANEFQPGATEAGVTLTVNAPDGLPTVRADPDQIHQVLVNLIGNAIKFTPAGGTISVAVRSVNPSREVIPLPPGNWLLATVCDSGAGIAPEDLPHIFERFYRGDKARTARGSGLGLAIAKSIIDAHHGCMWAESASGNGTTLAFALPM